MTKQAKIVPKQFIFYNQQQWFSNTGSFLAHIIMHQP